MYVASSRYLNAEPAGCWGNIALRKGTARKGVRMRIGWLPTWLNWPGSMVDTVIDGSRHCSETRAGLSAMGVSNGYGDERG